jgi:hypothetical protein
MPAVAPAAVSLENYQASPVVLLQPPSPPRKRTALIFGVVAVAMILAIAAGLFSLRFFPR